MHWIANQGYALMVITAILWSANAIIGRAVHEIIPPIGLGFWRWVVTLPIFIALAWPHFRREWPLVRRHWPMLAFLGFLSVTVYNTFAYIALNTTTAINMLLINTARPVVIVFFSYAFFRDRVTPIQAAGFGLALAGTLTILARGTVEAILDVRFIPGDLWVVAATVSWALYTVLYRKRPPLHPTNLMLVTIVMGMAIMMPFYLWETFYVRSVPLIAQTYWSVAYLGLISGAIGYLAFNRMVELLGANRAGLTSYIVPVIGTTLAIVFLGEQLHGYHLAGIGLILVGVVFANGSLGLRFTGKPTTRS
jgi:drug/metabolite transporter (DMT)-like permease